MRNIDLRGLLLGGLLAFIGFMAVTTIFAIAKVKLVGPSAGIYTLGNLLGLIGICLVCYMWSGFITSKLSRRGKILNPMIISFAIMIMGFFPVAELPLWYVITSSLLAMPVAYLGALIHQRSLTNIGTESQDPSSSGRT